MEDSVFKGIQTKQFIQSMQSLSSNDPLLLKGKPVNSGFFSDICGWEKSNEDDVDKLLKSTLAKCDYIGDYTAKPVPPPSPVLVAPKKKPVKQAQIKLKKSDSKESIHHACVAEEEDNGFLEFQLEADPIDLSLSAHPNIVHHPEQPYDPGSPKPLKIKTRRNEVAAQDRLNLIKELIHKKSSRLDDRPVPSQITTSYALPLISLLSHDAMDLGNTRRHQLSSDMPVKTLLNEESFVHPQDSFFKSPKWVDLPIQQQDSTKPHISKKLTHKGFKQVLVAVPNTVNFPINLSTQVYTITEKQASHPSQSSPSDRSFKDEISKKRSKNHRRPKYALLDEF